MLTCQPPFPLTHRMTALLALIVGRLGAWTAANRAVLVLVCRRPRRCGLWPATAGFPPPAARRWYSG